ncbi:hypothetical protein [Pedobacter frigoris]|uniref:hypothetical protein n=1 Tax=Pedobacter frigoris TaxID=2571272 RepID=UPI002930A8D8|nr:hypothetical protein [Pedobacter frigoris]
MANFYAAHDLRGVFLICEKTESTPAFYYSVNDRYLYAESSATNELIPITKRIITFADLEQFCRLILGLKFHY